MKKIILSLALFSISINFNLEKKNDQKILKNLQLTASEKTKIRSLKLRLHQLLEIKDKDDANNQEIQDIEKEIDSIQYYIHFLKPEIGI